LGSNDKLPYPQWIWFQFNHQYYLSYWLLVELILCIPLFTSFIHLVLVLILFN
jgi:hypothetical protein